MRFSREEIRQFIVAFKIEDIEWQNRNTPHPDLAMCVFLYRMPAAGMRLKDETKIFNDILGHLVTMFRSMLDRDDRRLSLSTIQAECYKQTFWGAWTSSVSANILPEVASSVAISCLYFFIRVSTIDLAPWIFVFMISLNSNVLCNQNASFDLRYSWPC